MKSSVNPKIIEMFTTLYKKDHTTIKLEEIIMEVTNGIRQCCTASKVLFKLITFEIIKRLQELDKGYKDDTFKIPCLFFADDGMLLTNNELEPKEIMEETIKISTKYGLEINKEKSQIIIYNLKNKPDKIKDIQVTDKMKYLGIIINDSKKCFKKHKKNIFEKARKLANMTCPVINKSCSRILIGKNLPTLLYGINIMDVTKEEIETLHKIENNVYRMILRAPNYTQAAALRGEIGATSMKARILKGQ